MATIAKIISKPPCLVILVCQLANGKLLAPTGAQEVTICFCLSVYPSVPKCFFFSLQAYLKCPCQVWYWDGGAKPVELGGNLIWGLKSWETL